ncbi:MAG: peptide-methionine (S)-S-oxide reductase [Nitrososphaeraceae archaeon]|nr:peptide-methionine (S)-S-oxide reductase [Nitrososphaeraceae archaeon]
MASDPITKNRQGWDIGSQYRSLISYHTPEQQSVANFLFVAAVVEEGK